jgi:hypothetical protein
MCRVLVISDERNQWDYVREVVYCHNPKHQVVPEEFVAYGPRPGVNAKCEWIDSVLAPLADQSPVVAIVDLHLSRPENTRDPEGIWILNELYSRFPECYLILVTGKVKISAIGHLPVPVRGLVSIASSNQSRFVQLKQELDKATSLATH